MKKLLLIFALAGTVSAQEYLLPIGKNVNSRVAEVALSIGGWRNRASFSYTPTMGDLQTIIIARLRELADSFTPVPGLENETYGLQVLVNPGPYVVVDFTPININGKWIVPPEVLEVELNYGVGTGWKLQGINAVIMRLYKNGDVVKYYSTKEGVGGDSPCDIGSAQSAQAAGYASVLGPYGLPWLKENWWDTGEITIESFDGWATFFNANGSPRDGELIAASSPPPAFLESLRAPEMPAQSQAPVLVISSPRISRITRVGHTTEITVSAEASGNAHLEFAEAIGGNWSAVPAYPVPLSLKAGTSSFTHTTDAPASFYRLRVSSSPQ